MICRGRHLSDKRMSAGDIDNPYQTTYQNLSTKMLEPIFDEIEMSEIVVIEIDKSCLIDDLDPVILGDII